MSFIETDKRHPIMWRKKDKSDQIAYMSHRTKHINGGRKRDICWQMTVCTDYNCTNVSRLVRPVLSHNKDCVRVFWVRWLDLSPTMSENGPMVSFHHVQAVNANTWRPFIAYPCSPNRAGCLRPLNSDHPRSDLTNTGRDTTARFHSMISNQILFVLTGISIII